MRIWRKDLTTYEYQNIPRIECKIEKILKGSLVSIPSPSRSREHLIFFCFYFFGQTLLGVVNIFFCAKSLLTTPSNIWPLHFMRIFPPIIWTFTESEGDGIKSRLSSKISFYFSKDSLISEFFSLCLQSPQKMCQKLS